MRPKSTAKRAARRFRVGFQLFAPVAFQLRRAARRLGVLEQRGVLFAGQIGFMRDVILARIQRQVIQAALQLHLERRIEAGIHRQELAGFRISLQTRAAIHRGAVTTAHESRTPAAAKNAGLPKRVRPNTPVTRLLAPWLIISRRLGLKRVAKIGEQQRNARIVQVVKRERNHSSVRAPGVSGRDRVVVGIEITNLCVAGPMHQAVVGPGIGHAQKLSVKAPFGAAVQIGACDPQQCFAGRAGCKRQGLEDQAVEFGALAKQLPVVAASLLELAGLLVVIFRQLLLANQAAESMRGEAEARVDLAELAVGQYGKAIGVALEIVQGGESLEHLQLAIVARIAAISAGGGSDGGAQRIEFQRLQTIAEQIAINASGGRSQVQRGRWHSIGVASASGAKKPERKRGGGALPGRGPRAGQDPDIAQTIVRRIAVAQRIAQHREEGTSRS